MPSSLKKIASNEDTGFLKLLAILSMTVDHVGIVFFPGVSAWRIVGRVAFPLFAYCTAVGCARTHNFAKYALRVGILAILVQPLYMTALGHAPKLAFSWTMPFDALGFLRHYGYFSRLNILFTLLLAILILWTVRERAYAVTVLLALAAWKCTGVINYGARGVLLVALFYVFLDRPFASLAWTGILMIDWGFPQLFSLTLNYRNYVTQAYALLALPLVYLPMRTGIKAPKWLFYAYYPAHLGAIYLISHLGG